MWITISIVVVAFVTGVNVVVTLANTLTIAKLRDECDRQEQLIQYLADSQAEKNAEMISRIGPEDPSDSDMWRG